MLLQVLSPVVLCRALAPMNKYIYILLHESPLSDWQACTEQNNPQQQGYKWQWTHTSVATTRHKSKYTHTYTHMKTQGTEIARTDCTKSHDKELNERAETTTMWRRLLPSVEWTWRYFSDDSLPPPSRQPSAHLLARFPLALNNNEHPLNKHRK